MSLLLDARKKSQQAGSAQTGNSGNAGLELSLEPHPDSVPRSDVPPAASSTDTRARFAGQNLFNAKSSSSVLGRAGINRNLLIILGGVVLFVIAGAGYVWYGISANQPRSVKPLAKSATAVAQPQNDLVPGIAVAPIPSANPSRTARHARAAHLSVKTHQQARNENHAVQIVQHQDDSIDRLLNDAYLAYRNGEYDDAQKLYGQTLKLDANNIDALLGLAVIAQRRGRDNEAAQYYARVMELDPRNAVANSGMSALTNSNNRESRLKTLLDEQPDSPSLHLALGNYYAGQMRWGEAQRAYFDAYKLAPDQADLAFNLATSLDRLGQKKSAAEYYQRALQLDPGQHAGFDHNQITQRIEALTH